MLTSRRCRTQSHAGSAGRTARVPAVPLPGAPPRRLHPRPLPPLHPAAPYPRFLPWHTCQLAFPRKVRDLNSKSPEHEVSRRWRPGVANPGHGNATAPQTPRTSTATTCESASSAQSKIGAPQSPQRVMVRAASLRQLLSRVSQRSTSQAVGHFFRQNKWSVGQPNHFAEP
jgi:hypothetical protein